tara:strand:+ start:13419 stop:14396 length:978 start_codon:yes stop_codon:yes gene_type:complete
MSIATKNTDIYLNAIERSIQYQGIRKDITDSYWETDISPLLYPLWDSAKDKLEVFLVRKDGTYSIHRNKYKKNFNDNSGKWISYEFDPAGTSEYNVEQLATQIKEKFIEFRDVEENRYEKAIQTEYARTNSVTWNKLKLLRRFMLQDSDYVLLEDSPVSDADKLLWKKYRSYIRDIPVLQNAATPYDIVLPITPDEYNKRKTLDVDQIITDNVGDQGTTSEYLTSSYHFWKVTENTLQGLAQRMTFYMMARTSCVEDVTGNENLAATNSSMRIMVSPFRTKLSSDGPAENLQGATELAQSWKADDEKVNRDYIEALLDAIENGEL